jgi:hypothetical protein
MDDGMAELLVASGLAVGAPAARPAMASSRAGLVLMAKSPFHNGE